MEENSPTPAQPPLPNLGPPPLAGRGLHLWILEFTRRQVLRGRSISDVAARTLRLTKGLGREEAALRREIQDAAQGAALWCRKHRVKPKSNNETQPQPQHPRIALPPWWFENKHLVKRAPMASSWRAPADEKLIERILSAGMRAPTLNADAPLRFDLGMLFAGLNFSLCAAKHVYQPEVRKLRQWQEQPERLLEQQWLVPNPFAKCGLGGRFKTDKNASGERLWLIIEFDQHTITEQGQLLRWLEQRGAEDEWRLALAVFSGGKSLHGWFSCLGRPKKEVCKFFRLATTLGADPAMRSSVQFTRMPMGRNSKTKAIQRIMHWNPGAMQFHNRELRAIQQSRMEVLA